LKRPRAGRSGDVAKVFRRGGGGGGGGRPAAVAGGAEGEKVAAGLYPPRGLGTSASVGSGVGNGRERPLDSRGPPPRAAPACPPPGAFWLIDRCSGEDGLRVAAVSSVAGARGCVPGPRAYGGDGRTPGLEARAVDRVVRSADAIPAMPVRRERDFV